MATSPDVRRNCGRVIRRFAFGALVLALVVVVLGATSPGLAICAKAASAVVGALTPFSFHVTGVSGVLPFALHVHRLELLDRAGVWLAIEDLGVRTRLQGFLAGQFRLEYLTAKEVRWDRRPIREKRWRIPRIPGLDHYPAADTISIGQLSLGPSVMGHPLAVTVNGHIENTLGGAGQKIVLAAHRSDGKAGTLDIDYEQNRETPTFHAHLDDSDIVPYWLGLDSAVVLDVSGSGPRTDWRGTLQASAGAQSILDGRLHFLGEFPTVITATLDASIAQSRRLQTVERFLGTDTHFSLDALLAKSGQLDILGVSASSPRGSLQGAGTVLLPEKAFNLAFQGSHADLALLSCNEERTGIYIPAEISGFCGGDPSKIDGRLVASSHAVPFLVAETTLLPGQPARIDGTATVFSAGLADVGSVSAFLGDTCNVAWSTEYAVPAHLTLSAFGIESAALNIHGTGSIGFPSASVHIGYAGVLHAERIPVLAEYVQSEEGVSLTGDMNGPMTALTVSLKAQPVDFANKGFLFQDGTINLGFRLDNSGIGKSIRNGSFRLDSPKCGYGQIRDLNASCTGRFESEDFEAFRLHDVELAAPDIATHLTAEVDYVRSTGKTDLHGCITTDDLAATSALYPHTLTGAVSGTFRGRMDGRAKPLQFSADLDWPHSSGLPASIQSVLGDRVRAAIRLESDKDRITFQEASIAAEPTTITASGHYDKRDRLFDVHLKAKAEDMGRVLTAQPFQDAGNRKNGRAVARWSTSPGPSGHPLRKGDLKHARGPVIAQSIPQATSVPPIFQGIKGAFEITSRLQGTSDDLAVTGDAHIDGLSWNRLAVRSTKLKFATKHLPSSPEGTVSLSSTNGKKGPTLDGSLGFRFEEKRLHVEKAKLSLAKNRLQGGCDFRTDTREFSANADFDLPALKELSDVLGMDLSGSAKGKVAASKKGDKLDFTLHGKAEKVGTPWGTMGSIDADGSVTDVLGKPQGNVIVAAANCSRKRLDLSRADITISGDGSSATAKATMTGLYTKNETEKPEPFTLKTKSTASLPDQSLIVTETSGSMAGVNFSLSGPAKFHRSGADYTLDEMAFQLGEGTGALSIRKTGSDIHAVSSWKDFPLFPAILAGSGPIEGRSSGSLIVEGPLQAPSLHLETHLAKVRHTALDHGPGMDATIKAVHDGQWTSTEITATLSDAAKASVSARIPLNLSLSPACFAVREQDALQADADVSADLAACALLMDWINDLPQGTVAGKFQLSGTVAAPKISGELNLENGGYENLRYGAVLKDLHVRLAADGNMVRIAEFKGTDGEEGRLSATGQLEVSFADRHPFHADVTLDRMRSIRTEYGSGMLSGRFQLDGNMADAKLNGGVTVQEGDFRMPDRTNSARKSNVEFTEKNAPKPPPSPKPAAAPVLPAVALDLSVSVPGRVFLHGPVIETEWNGDMRVRGTLKEPRIEGDMRVRRGYLDIVGQRFALADSVVRFTNGDVRSPYLDMTGVCAATDITARIQFTGPPDDTQLALSSDPPLPQDEILSKLLFRKGVSQASPLQAIQIARAAAMFSDRLSLPQFLTGSVKLPGVDLFDVRTGERIDRTVVGVGKYINDKIYVEAEQGAATDSGRVSAQVEVTPRVSVKADVGARNRGGVGIMWKKDY